MLASVGARSAANRAVTSLKSARSWSDAKSASAAVSTQTRWPASRRRAATASSGWPFRACAHARLYVQRVLWGSSRAASRVSSRNAA